MDQDQFKRNLVSTFDGIAERYDQNRFFAISAKKMAELIPPSEPMRVLDVSTGTGAVAVEVAGRHRHAAIEAVDISTGMLARAENKARQQGVANIAFRQCDVDHLPYGDESFEVITCGYAMFFYAQMEAVYRSLCRMVKPGGLLLFSSFTKQSFRPCARMFLERIEGQYGVDVPTERMERLKTREQAEALAALSRPKKVTVLHHPIRYPISLSQWWSLCNNAGFKGLLDQLDREQLPEFKQAHLAELDAVADNGGIELNADTLFTIVNI